MEQAARYEAVVVGAGFGGLYMLKKLRDELGLKVQLFETGAGVGGTWYWNRYPGALSDTESFAYCYSWDRELLQDWDFTTRYLTQPQILNYLNHVADKHDLRRDIRFNTGLAAARFDEASGRWEIETSTGEHCSAKYLVTAVGVLSATNIPPIAGLDRFRGTWVHTGNWAEGVELEGKRVGVVGTGSTGTQVITAIAPIAGHLTVFQRSPQYSVPVGNGPVSRETVAEIKRNYQAIWHQIRNSALCFGFEESTVPAMSVSPEERQAIFQKAWDQGGGFRFMFETFGDIVTDEAANLAAQDFIRGKIAEIVHDPETAAKLTPRDLYAKRPLCNNDYYATFNRENVALVDIKANPIIEITEAGLRTSDGVEHPLDVLIFATGFDAVDGNFRKIDIRGRGGVALNDLWPEGPTSYMALMNAQMPNMFTVLGPNGPFSNIPPAIEIQVEWISDAIAYTEKNRFRTVEATLDAERQWTELCVNTANMTLFPKVESWIFGLNVAGKAHTVYFFLGGVAEYRRHLDAVRDNHYNALKFS